MSVNKYLRQVSCVHGKISDVHSKVLHAQEKIIHKFLVSTKNNLMLTR